MSDSVDESRYVYCEICGDSCLYTEIDKYTHECKKCFEQQHDLEKFVPMDDPCEV